MKKTLFILAIVVIFGRINVANAQETVLLNFSGSNGQSPSGALYYDGTFLYGTTALGGSSYGVIYKIKTDGTGYTDLLDFNGTIGEGPVGSLISDGTFLYGMTNSGGTYGKGTVYKIKLDGTGSIVLLDFNGTNGYWPYGSLISDGTFLYGMTLWGGANNQGLVFKIKPDGTGYADLLDFNSINGEAPKGSLVSDGTFLYGMTSEGGLHGDGVVFKIKTDGTGYAKLLDFNGTNGSSPKGTLISDGTFLYGLTYYGGTSNDGVVFKIKPDGSSYTKLLDFSGGGYPIASLISYGGILYGIYTYDGPTGSTGYSFGNIFKIMPDGTGFYSLFEFNSFDGMYGLGPNGSLICDGTFLYGVTVAGGGSNDGVVFKFALTATGISEINNKSDIVIYPNPNNGNFTLSYHLNNNPNTLIQIKDVTGRIVYTANITGTESKQNINATGLNDGIYYWEVLSGNEILDRGKIAVIK